MFNLLGLKNTTKMVALSNKIRRSAFNLMLYKGSESSSAAGAMVVCSCPYLNNLILHSSLIGCNLTMQN